MASYEEAHQRFIETHMEGRAGERKGRLARGHKISPRSYSCRTFGGRYSAASSICIPNMRSMIGIANLNS